MRKNVAVYNIDVKHKMVVGDYYEVRELTHNPVALLDDGDIYAAVRDQSHRILRTEIRRAVFMDAYSNKTEKYFTVEPQHQEMLLLLVEQYEINRLGRAKKHLEDWLYKEQCKNKKLVDASIFTRLKWLFTGIKF